MQSPRGVRANTVLGFSESRSREWIDNEVVGCEFEDLRYRKRLRHFSGAVLWPSRFYDALGIRRLSEHEEAPQNAGEESTEKPLTDLAVRSCFMPSKGSSGMHKFGRSKLSTECPNPAARPDLSSADSHFLYRGSVHRDDGQIPPSSFSFIAW